MDIKEVLHVGVGRCGNNIVNDIMSKDSRYAGFMINTAKADMVNLSNYKRAGSFPIPHANGSGGDREVAANYANYNLKAIADKFIEYNHYRMFNVYFSADGGTGSGASPVIIRAIKRVMPKVPVIAVVVFPGLFSSTEALRNTLDCWDDLMELREEKLLAGIRIVDNSRRETIVEINEEIVKYLDMTFKLDTYCDDGTLDDRDIRKFLSISEDYHITLILDKECENLKDAIAKATKESVFLTPSSFDCEYLGILTNGGWVSTEEARKVFHAFGDAKVGTSHTKNKKNPDVNVLIATGLPIPVARIEELGVALEDLENNNRKRVKDASLFMNRNKRNKDKSKMIEEVSFTINDIDDLFDEDDWS